MLRPPKRSVILRFPKKLCFARPWSTIQFHKLAGFFARLRVFRNCSIRTHSDRIIQNDNIIPADFIQGCMQEIVVWQIARAFFYQEFLERERERESLAYHYILTQIFKTSQGHTFKKEEKLDQKSSGWVSSSLLSKPVALFLWICSLT